MATGPETISSLEASMPHLQDGHAAFGDAASQAEEVSGAADMFNEGVGGLRAIAAAIIGARTDAILGRLGTGETHLIEDAKPHVRVALGPNNDVAKTITGLAGEGGEVGRARAATAGMQEAAGEVLSLLATLQMKAGEMFDLAGVVESESMAAKNRTDAVHGTVKGMAQQLRQSMPSE